MSLKFDYAFTKHECEIISLQLGLWFIPKFKKVRNREFWGVTFTPVYNIIHPTREQLEGKARDIKNIQNLMKCYRLQVGPFDPNFSKVFHIRNMPDKYKKLEIVG